MTRVEQFEAIRKDRDREGLSVRALAKKHKVHRRAVRQALTSAVPPPRKPPVRPQPKFGPYAKTVRDWLIADKSAPKKQRHTARRVWERLVEEFGAQLSESTVRTHVRAIRAELGRELKEVMIPQTHLLGEEAECDFGEFYVDLCGIRTKLWLFILRLSASGKAFRWVCTNESTESFLEGHVRAFSYFGGIPKVIRYDNLKAAVLKVLLGRSRLENPRFVALRSHYLFDSFYCIPGEEGSHEKGGVEGEVGRFRRRHFVPVPYVSSVAEAQAIVDKANENEGQRRIDGRPVTVGEHFAAEAERLRPLPLEPFDAASELSCRVDKKARICVRQAYYSVPARFSDRRLRVRLYATRLEVFDGGRVIASHERALHKKEEKLDLDHYLEVLQIKPGALKGATALVQAKSCGHFTKEHQDFWDLARAKAGDQAGTKALVEVLLCHRRHDAQTIKEALRRAVSAGITDPAVIAIEARRIKDAASSPRPLDTGTLGRYDRRPPSLGRYDSLLVRDLDNVPNPGEMPTPEIVGEHRLEAAPTPIAGQAQGVMP